MLGTGSLARRSSSVTPRRTHSLEHHTVPPASASTLRKRRRRQAGTVATPSRQVRSRKPRIDPSYSTDEEGHGTTSTLGAPELQSSDATHALSVEGNTPLTDPNAVQDITNRRDSGPASEAAKPKVALQCDELASGAPTSIGGLRFPGTEENVSDGDVFVCATSGPGNYDRVPQSLAQAKRKLRKMALKERSPSTSPSETEPLIPTTSPSVKALAAVSKAEKLKAPPFDLHGAFDPVGDAIKKSRQLIDYARNTSDMIRGSPSTSDRSNSVRGSPGQRPMTGPASPLTLTSSQYEPKRDSVVTPPRFKGKGTVIPPITPVGQSRLKSPQLSPTANRLSTDDLFPDIYKSPVLGSQYRSPTIEERDRDLNDRLALNAKKSAPPGVEVHDFATGSRNVSGLSEPGSLRQKLLKGARQSAPQGEGIEVHDFAAGERDVEGLSEVDWCRTPTKSQNWLPIYDASTTSSPASTPSKRALAIQLKSGGWSVRAPKSSPIVETSNANSELVNASMSRLYDVVSPMSLRSLPVQQTTIMKENATPVSDVEASLPAKLRVKRRKRPTTQHKGEEEGAME